VESLTGESIEEFPPTPKSSGSGGRGLSSGSGLLAGTKGSGRKMCGIHRPVKCRRRDTGEEFVVLTLSTAARLFRTSPTTLAKVLDGEITYVPFWYDGTLVDVCSGRRRGDGVVPLPMVPQREAARAARQRAAAIEQRAQRSVQRRQPLLSPLPMSGGRGRGRSHKRGS
jgi:hypothetical protein